MKTLDLKNRREYLSPAFSDIYENGEIEEWKVRAVTFLDKTSTKDIESTAAFHHERPPKARGETWRQFAKLWSEDVSTSVGGTASSLLAGEVERYPRRTSSGGDSTQRFDTDTKGRRAT